MKNTTVNLLRELLVKWTLFSQFNDYVIESQAQDITSNLGYKRHFNVCNIES